MLLHLSRASFFGTRTNVFLPAKAETAVETRQDSAVFLKPRRRGRDYADGTDEALAKLSASLEKILADDSKRCNEKAATLVKCGGFCE
jgi:hypothetical protein